MFERFTDRARRVVVLAQEEARGLNHNYIGTEHLLLGLIHEDEGVGAQALHSLGISLAAVRDLVQAIIGQGQAVTVGHIPFTPRAKKVLELSLRESLQLGHNYIGTEHILLALVREGEGVAAQVLVKLGGNLGVVRKTVVALLGAGVSPEVVATTRLEGGPPGDPVTGFRSTPFGQPPEETMPARREELQAIEALAQEEAARLGHGEAGPAHRWLGYVRLRIEEARKDLGRLVSLLDEGRRRVAEHQTEEQRLHAQHEGHASGDEGGEASPGEEGESGDRDADS